MLSHWDDVPWTAKDRGDLRAERQRLGAAAGAVAIGLSRYRIAPGCRAMPLHVHLDEEEVFFVLAGSGSSWQDGARHAVRAGDTIVHRPSEEAHTLLAGDGAPLDVLAFGSGSPTGLTQLPRADVTWVGSRWLPQDAPHPFEAEPPVSAGELPPLTPRPDTVVALGDVEGQALGRGGVQRVRRNLGVAAGSVHSGLQHVTVAPGARSSPRHCHSVEEELFVVLEGEGVVVLGDEEHPVRAGSVVARPPATGVAHCFRAGAGGMTMLAYGTRDASDMCWYPDSSKVAFRGLRVVARVQQLGYWDGEE